jgi:hypothetical protein
MWLDQGTTQDPSVTPLRRVERRAAIRFDLDGEAACALGPQEHLVWGRLRDISMRGVGLLLDREVKLGTQLVVEVTSKIHPLPLRVRARVVRCEKHSSTTWVIGCKFDTPLCEEELRVGL